MKIFLALTLCFLLAPGAFAQDIAPNGDSGTALPSSFPPPDPNSLESQIQNAERTQNADALLLLYGGAITTPEGARIAIGRLLSSYYALRNQAQTADQATQAVGEAMLRFSVLHSAQNQILIQQNQQLLQQNARIIALLEAGARVPTSALSRTATPR